MTRFYIKVARVPGGDDEHPIMSSVWDSRLDFAEGKRFQATPRMALTDWLNEFTGRVISIYEVYVNDNGSKELIAWLELD